jgi:hypothetical protein
VDATVILAELAARGAQVRIVDGALGVRPVGALDDGLRAELRAHKAELVVLIQAQCYVPVPVLASGCTHWCPGTHQYPVPLPAKIARCSRCTRVWRRPDDGVAPWTGYAVESLSA